MAASVRCAVVGLGLVLVAACLPPAPPPVLSPPPAPAAPDPWAQVDRYALAAPAEAARSPEALAAYLKGAGPSQEAVARALYRWIAANVTYDVEGFASGAYGDTSPEGVLQRRKAVCEGFGSLFERLATEAGLETVTIHGYAKGVGYRAGEPFKGPPNHAWNAVRIGGSWRLLDCTWGAGVLDESGAYVRYFEPFYFFTPPEKFLFTHWPSEEIWQGVEHPIDRAAFEALPWLKPAFFHAGLGLPGGGVRREGDTASLLLDAPENAQVRLYLMRRGEKARLEPLPMEVRRGGLFARTALPGPGPFVLRLFAAHARLPGVLEWAADFVVPELAEDEAGSESP